MKTSQKHAALAAALVAVAGAGALASVDYTGTIYAPWTYSAGAVAWRAATTETTFHNSTVADIAADGSEGTAYAMTADNGTASWQRFASNQSAYSAPGIALVYDTADCRQSSDAQFDPLSIGGLWVSALADTDGNAYTIAGTGTRTTEFGKTGYSSYFKLEKSFTIDRASATTFYGDATVELATAATFTSSKSTVATIVDADATLALSGSGVLVPGSGLTVNGTLDLTATSIPTIQGNVTIASSATVKIPAGATEIDLSCVTGTITVPSTATVDIGGTAGTYILTLDGTTKKVALSTTVAYTATISGDIAFEDIVWDNGATMGDLPLADITISGTGTVTGMTEAPAKLATGADVVIDASELDLSGATLNLSGALLYTKNYPAAVPSGCTYIYSSASTDPASPVSLANLQVSGTLKTQGCFFFDQFRMMLTTAVFDITSGTVEVTTPDNTLSLTGVVTIRSGATLKSNTTDALAYNYSSAVNVYGTLDLADSRWSVGNYNVIRLYGGTVVGNGQTGNGAALDFMDGGAMTVHADSTISAPCKFRNQLTSVTVDSGFTLAITGATVRGYDAGGITKAGDGTLEFASNPVLSAGITVSAGALAFDTGDDVTITATYTSVPAAANMAYAQQSNWKGTVKFAALSAPGNLSVLASCGNADSTIALAGVSGNAYIMASGSTTYNIPGTLSIDGATAFNNGSSGSTVNIAKLAGSGALTLASWAGCSSARYNLASIDGYAGDFTVRNGITRSGGGTLTIGIGDIVNEAAALETCLLKTTETAVENPTGAIAYNFDSGAVNGVSTNLCYDTVGGESGIYIAAAEIAGVRYATVQNALDSLGDEPSESAIEAISVLDSGATIPSGYRNNDGTLGIDINYAAQIGTVKYETLAEAVAALTDSNCFMPGLTLLDDVTDESGITIPALALPVKIDGGSHTLTASVTVEKGANFTPQNVVIDGEMVVNGGLYSVAGYGATFAGALVLNDATITFTAAPAGDTAIYAAGGAVTVKGTLTVSNTSASPMASGTAYKILSGESMTVAEGASVVLQYNNEAVEGWSYIADETSFYVKAMAARVDGQMYETFAEAVAAADGVETIELLASVAGEYHISAGETLIVKKGDFSLSVVLDDTDGYTLEESVEGGVTTYTVVAKAVLDPSDETSTFASDAETEESALAAAVAAVVVPDGAAGFVDAATYASYFDYIVTGEAGAYVVAVSGIKAAIVQAAEESALEFDENTGEATISIPAGLYYGVGTAAEPGDAKVTVAGVANGTDPVTVAKPGDGRGFIKVVISPSPVAVE